MALLIEEQMFEFMKRQEEDRFAAEQEKGDKPRRRSVSKPWTRPGKHCLCQDPDLLQMVSQFDYKLSNKRFREYCEARNILYVAGEVDSTRWKYFEDHSRTREDFMNEPYFQYAERVGDRQYRYTEQERETDWKIIQIGRAALQDCWEIYQAIS